ncbi:beta-carotene hydroxylase [Pacificimonas flava]|uniref:Beta-carotene hydroxylase n=2 Tax=Pacificimonas TaxID=1960290 RepID=A0A219B079_9SPHN|nr:MULTISPECIES: sterol desaturase family protein [Pacificimonas]MBZ6379774.1 sterol desaturase family protein [Pacificimonas aurantium]OWV31772.1 beta-carotene hydroxylase [Pacificimonas flava]
MPLWSGLLLTLATVLLMEGFAYGMHRWVMHGFLWSLHKSHHEPRQGIWEANDWFGVIFAVPSILLIFLGTQTSLWTGLAWIGLGIALYGLIYFVFHDWLVHERLPSRFVPKSAYMKRIVQAHKLHHVVNTKHGTVSFGFLWAPPVSVLKAQLAENRKRGEAGLRAPRGPSAA